MSPIAARYLSGASLLSLAALMTASCYRAEVDITVFTSVAGSGGGAGGSEQGGQPNGGDSAGSGGVVETSGGAGGTAGAAGQISGAAGAAGAAGNGPECDDAPLADDDLACRTHIPSRAQCALQDPVGFDGCSAGGCAVCADVLASYPYYFHWHPCCQPNPACAASQRVKCNARCPIPTAHDALRPCWMAPTND